MPAMWIPLNIWSSHASEHEILVLPAEGRKRKDRPVGPNDPEWGEHDGEEVTIDGRRCLTRPPVRDRDPEAWAAFEAEERRRNDEDRCRG